MAACTHEDINIPTVSQEDGERVTLNFDVQIPEAKAVNSRFADDVTLGTLYVLVFDNSGFLTDFGEATLANTTVKNETDGETINAVTTFSVSLKETSEGRILHFVGNYFPAKKNDFEYTSEYRLLSNLDAVTDSKGVYWQRVVSPNGVNKAAVTGRMDPVYLIRNCAKVTVDGTKTITNFKYTGFAVVNTESHGSVAPYIMTSDDAAFAQYVETNPDGTFVKENGLAKQTGYEHLVNTQGFEGYVPENSNVTNAASSLTDTKDGGLTFNTYNKFIYERTHNASAPTFIIIKGQWNETDTYYKVDLSYVRDAVIVPYHILRNFAYNITINSVTGTGYPTAKQAAEAASSSNITADVSLEHLLNISATGESRLFVNYVKKTLVSTADVYLEYMYTYKNTEGTWVIDNSKVRHNWTNTTNGKVINNITVSADNVKVENEGYASLTITPKTSIPTAEEEESIILYVDEDGDGVADLQRKVTYAYRNPYPLEATCTNPVSNRMGAQVNVNIIIDDDLPSYLFPLTFFVESSALSIYPAANSNMPVNNRTTVVDGKSGNSFGFDRVLTWEEYDDLTSQDGKVSVPCHFLTNMDESDCTIYVYNELFTLGKCTFATETFKDFINTSITTSVSVGIEKTVDYTFTTPTATNVTVTIKEGDVVTTETIETIANETKKLPYSTKTWGQGVVITLEAEGYNRVTLNCGRTLTIPEGNLKYTKTGASFGYNYSNVSVHLTDNYSNGIEFSGDSSNNNDITIYINNISSADDYLYFSYRVVGGLSGSTRYTYYAKAKISDILSNNGVTLSFNTTKP